MADVMLIEDDPDVRVDLAFMLQQKGYKVSTARNGADALQRIKEEGVPRLILLDLMMPDLDGWGFHRVLQQHPALRSVPVVIVSGIADVGDEATMLGATWLTKPVDLEQLYQVVNLHLAARVA